MLREPDLSQYLAGTGGFQSPDDHYAGFVRSVPADLPDDRVASDFIGDPGGDGVSYGMAGVQSVYRHLLPEEDWKAYEYVDMPECWYIKNRNRSFVVRMIGSYFFSPLPSELLRCFTAPAILPDIRNPLICQRQIAASSCPGRVAREYAFSCKHECSLFLNLVLYVFFYGFAYYFGNFRIEGFR